MRNTRHTARKADFRRGYRTGYDKGFKSGKETFGTWFEGTSIIIPTYNQKQLLLQCVDYIEAHTVSPYEIIIVDNGSQDGTVEALRRRRGSLRIAAHSSNLGFAQAINTGLMMARGQTIVLLNNDVFVTEGWLTQMLACLYESPDTAAVGPVTNYISGEQKIDVPYHEISEMPRFAAAYNRRDPGKWRDTSRLVGFCILMKRSTFEQVGYLDEGYEVGNFEDDDWNLRLRLQGKRMRIAGDTFVHHIGSVTMKGLGEKQFSAVNDRNGRFYTQKWGDRYERVRSRVKESTAAPYQAADFFPTHTWIRSASGKLFWMQHGVKHPVSTRIRDEAMIASAVQLSVIELLQIPTGSEYGEAELAAIKGDLFKDGKVVIAEDGTIYQLDQGAKRAFVSHYACTAWGFIIPKQVTSHEVWNDWAEGLPIAPPTRLKSVVL
ncbi:glycosyltransferase family 2 protein [Paenibacillus motobuensis]|uniref:Glycosyltransferase 2-like domain-containing protein n=1 Tax=Paenibacillus motobuensis TaxID=295324 RepID=A0ABN0YJQ9_9BACL